MIREERKPFRMKDRFPLFPLALAWTALLSALFGVALVNGWFGPASEANRYFCEYTQGGLLREPVNTVSNLAFVASGLAIAWQAGDGRKNPFARTPALVFLFSAFAIFLGFGSAAMHATQTDPGGEFDLLGMYLVAGFILAYAMRRYFGWGWRGFAVALVLAVLFCEAVGSYRQPVVPIVGYAGDAAFALLIALAVLFETLNATRRHVRRQNRWGVYGLLSFLAAFAVWNFGRTEDPICRPESWLQPHALWHLLFALAIYCVFRLYASEEGAGIKAS